MPPSPISSKSKRNARHAQRGSPPKRTSSEGTSSSADSTELAARSSSDDDDEFERASPSTSIEYQPEELDEPISWTFKNGDPVWIKTEDGEWLQGAIAGANTRKGATRQKEGLFFPVAFRHNSRKYFAPLNGDIKPDNPEVRRLLSEGGWL